MTEQEFYKLIHRRLAQISIGASAIRNQGAKGLIDILRDYFEKQIDLQTFISSLSDNSIYQEFLNRHTDIILRRFPETAQSWGAVRKGLNLFLREIVYSKFFSYRFKLPESFNDFNVFIKFMEVPLDKEVANGLINDSGGQLPKWTYIKRLTPYISELYQNQATIIGIRENIARVNLDIKYWRSV